MRGIVRVGQICDHGKEIHLAYVLESIVDCATQDYHLLFMLHASDFDLFAACYASVEKRKMSNERGS